MKKNVGLLVPSMYPGGAERVVSRLSHILSEEYNIFVIMFEDTYKEYECKGTIINLGIKAKPGHKLIQIYNLFRRSIKLKRVKKYYNIDTMISFLDSPNMVNILSGRKNCKNIISIRNCSSNINKGLKYKLLKYIYSKANYIVSVSKVITDIMIQDYNIPKENAVTIYNPYDINQIKSYASEELEEVAKEFFANSFIFISVGRQVYQKGYWHLIKAYKMVWEKNSNTKLIIIGKDERDSKKGQKLAKELGIESNILFTGYLENPFKYISKSNVYVLSSLFEGFPNALVEAMACGCPVIAADCKSGPREILYKDTDYKNECKQIEKADYGILTPPLEPEENWDISHISYAEKQLANAMLIYLENQELCYDYSKKGEERAREFTYEKCAYIFKKIVDD